LAIDPNGAVIFWSIAEVGNDFSVSVLDPSGSKLTSDDLVWPRFKDLPLSGSGRSGRERVLGGKQRDRSKPYLTKLDPQTGKFTQSIEPALASVESLSISPVAGPLLTGSNPLYTASRVIQYSSKLEMVYERDLPLPPLYVVAVAGDDVVLTGSTQGFSLPLLNNAYPCGRIPSPQSIDSPFLVRLSSTGELLQTTWLGTNSIFGAIPIPGGGIAAFRPIPASVAPLLTIRVFSLGLSDDPRTSSSLAVLSTQRASRRRPRAA
jgi:hypothetical protein